VARCSAATTRRRSHTITQNNSNYRRRRQPVAEPKHRQYTCDFFFFFLLRLSIPATVLWSVLLIMFRTLHCNCSRVTFSEMNATCCAGKRCQNKVLRGHSIVSWHLEYYSEAVAFVSCYKGQSCSWLYCNFFSAPWRDAGHVSASTGIPNADDPFLNLFSRGFSVLLLELCTMTLSLH